MSDAEREAALALLRDPQLLERVQRDLVACGLVGEERNKLLVYLAATSRKLPKPLAVMVFALPIENASEPHRRRCGERRRRRRCVRRRRVPARRASARHAAACRQQRALVGPDVGGRWRLVTTTSIERSRGVGSPEVVTMLPPSW
jgi:hypothetical protein